MLCRHCGTEIADKAIICFRCGAGTTDPVRKAVPVRRKQSPFLSLVILVLLVLLGLYLGQASRTAQEPDMLQIGAGVVFFLAAVLLVIRVVRRR
ncbi:hypothetical protein BH23ACI1_BH23ACI1_10650 [soil metagenome]|nr:zinc ribbon domain-containing protein [Acidobacteriota bacterium]